MQQVNPKVCPETGTLVKFHGVLENGGIWSK